MRRRDCNNTITITITITITNNNNRNDSNRNDNDNDSHGGPGAFVDIDFGVNRRRTQNNAHINGRFADHHHTKTKQRPFDPIESRKAIPLH